MPRVKLSGRCKPGMRHKADFLAGVPLADGGRLAVAEELLRGGFVTEVVRVGDTVRRRPGRNPGFVRRLLESLKRAGWDGAPRFRGVDEQGREILSFLPGHVPWQPAEQMRARSDDNLAVAAEP